MKERSIGIQMPREVHISRRYNDSSPTFIPFRYIVLKNSKFFVFLAVEHLFHS